MSTEGVLLAGVPGAGGFDAVFAIALGDSSSNVVKVWSSLNVLALLVREDPRGVYSESNDPRVKEVTGAVSSIHIKWISVFNTTSTGTRNGTPGSKS